LALPTASHEGKEVGDILAEAVLIVIQTRRLCICVQKNGLGANLSYSLKEAINQCLSIKIIPPTVLEQHRTMI
jgi:hypothetical protein